MSQNDIIAKRLSELRKEKGYTQDEVARMINVKRATIANYESGNRAPDHVTMIALADIYGVSCDYIIRGVKSEFADIHRITGLSNEAIEKLNKYKESLVYSKAIDYLLTHTELLRKLSTYLLSSLFLEFNQSDYYKYLPLKDGTIYYINPDIAEKVAFSNLIEQLPFDKENLKQELAQNKKFTEKVLFEIALKAADYGQILYQYYEDFSSDELFVESEKDQEELALRYTIEEEDRLSEEIKLIEEEHNKEVFIKEFMYRKEQKERDPNAHNPET